MYVLIPTSEGQAVLDTLATEPGMGAELAERLERAAESLTALLKCASSLIHCSDGDHFVLEVRLATNAWLS
jgi:hypothetical protein